MKFYKSITIVLLLLIAILLGVLVSNSFSEKEKIIVVDSDVLLENYQGFKDAQDVYELKIEKMKESLKVQSDLYTTKVEEYKELQGSGGVVVDEFELKKLELIEIQGTLERLKRSIEAKSSEEEQKLLSGVYNKVDDFVERYCKQNAIDVVLGASVKGNIVYRSEFINKTDELIKLLNEEYESGVK